MPDVDTSHAAARPDRLRREATPATGAAPPVATGSAPPCCVPAADSWSWPCCSPWSASPPWSRSAPTTSTTPTPRCASRTSSTCSPASPAPPSGRGPRSTGSSRTSETSSPTRAARAPRSSRPSSRSTPSTSWPAWCRSPVPGVRITITEQTGPVDIDSVLDTVEELRSAGAEAMQFNGQVRVVAQTSLEDEVGGFSVDGTAGHLALRHRRHRRPAHPPRRPRLQPGPGLAAARRRGRRADRRAGADRHRVGARGRRARVRPTADLSG